MGEKEVVKLTSAFLSASCLPYTPLQAPPQISCCVKLLCALYRSVQSVASSH